MQLPKSEQLNIAGLSRLFDNKAECYKLFWFQAILNHVCKGQQEIRFEELIDDMIANAWYMVTCRRPSWTVSVATSGTAGQGSWPGASTGRIS